MQLLLTEKANLMFHIKPVTDYQIVASKDVIKMEGCGLVTFGKADHV